MNRKLGVQFWNVLMVLVYLVLVVVCVMFTGNEQVSVYINTALFSVALMIFVFSFIKFSKVAGVAKELRRVEKRIREDFDREKHILWESYKNDETLGFKSPVLKDAYKNFCYEMNRIGVESNGSNKCRIEDYINEDIITVQIKKGVLDQVPGVFTGLGILGTFVGLSIGLGNFSFTAETAEAISESINSLMDGIKVAFHTSIYGTIFSLSYNWIYRMILESAYGDVDRFLDAFDMYVTGDSENDQITFMQTYLKEIPHIIGETISDRVNEMIGPQFERMNEIFDGFTKKVAENQANSMSMVVDDFVNQMNASLSGSFKNLGVVINETCELQKQNNDFIKGTLNSIGGMIADLTQIHEMTEKTIATFTDYMEKADELCKCMVEERGLIQETQEKQIEVNARNQEYIDKLVDYELRIKESMDEVAENMTGNTKLVKKQVETICDMVLNFVSEVEGKTTGVTDYMGEFLMRMDKHIDTITDHASENTDLIGTTAKSQIEAIMNVTSSANLNMDLASGKLTEAANQLNTNLSESLTRTFEIFDQNLAQITQRLSGTIMELRETTDRVPSVVSAAYEGMETIFSALNDKLTTLVEEVDGLQQKLRRNDH